MSSFLLKKKTVIFSFFLYICLIIFCLLFISLLVSVISKGFKDFSFSFIFSLPSSDFYLGGKGGIANALVGSLIICLNATLLAFILSLPLILYLNVYLKKGSRLGSLVRLSLDILWGIPSIVYGVCGITVMLLVGLSYSLIAAIIVVALLEIPILARALDEVVLLVPEELIETGFALGATSRQVAFRIVLKKIRPGIINALLLAFGRGLGDAAAVMLVAGFTDNLPSSLFKQVATLPVTVFYLVTSPFAEVRSKGYATALVLILLILITSFFTRIFGKKLIDK